MAACIKGNLEIAEMLLKAGADPAFEDFDGRTALNYAENGGHPELSRLIRQALDKR